ncbi:MAG: hypothetical protein ACYTEQ_28145, partial [Planctomycetota bacterium]
EVVHLEQLHSLSPPSKILSDFGPLPVVEFVDHPLDPQDAGAARAIGRGQEQVTRPTAHWLFVPVCRRSDS